MPNFTQFRSLILSSGLLLTTSLGFQSAAHAEIRGLYGSDCLSLEGLSAKKDLLFRDKTLETVQTVYADDVCEAPAYDFAFVGTVLRYNDSNAMDYTYSSIKLRPIDERVAIAFNEISLCGFDDWTMDEAKEVSGKDCGGQAIPASGTTVFDIIEEAENSESLQLGQSNETHDGLSLSARPIDYDKLIYHAR